MDYLSHNVAVNLKQIRLSKGMSLGEVAEQTGVSKSMLAQIEKGTANPSLGVLGKITSGLRIEFQTLIDPPREDFCLVSPKEIFPTKELEGTQILDIHIIYTKATPLFFSVNSGLYFNPFVPL